MNSRSGVSGTLHMALILDPEPWPQGQYFWPWSNTGASWCLLPQVRQKDVSWQTDFIRWYWVWVDLEMHTIWSSPPNNNGQFLLSPVAATVVYSGSVERYPLPLNPFTGVNSTNGPDWALLTVLTNGFICQYQSQLQQTEENQPDPASHSQHKHSRNPKRPGAPGYCRLSPAEKDSSCLAIFPKHPGAGMFLFEILTRRKSPLKIPGAPIFYTWWLSTT